MFSKSNILDAPSFPKGLLYWTRFVDQCVCTYLHNPVVLVTTALCASGVVAITNIPGGRVGFPQIDLIYDLSSHVVNILFMVRFVGYLAKGLVVKSNFAFELFLLVCQNLAVLGLVLLPAHLLLYWSPHPILRAFILWQILCPYMIFLLTYWEERTAKKRSLLSEKPYHIDWQSILVDTNNNFLPIFMAHSFAASALYDNTEALSLLNVYKIAMLITKLYLVQRYVLYELVVVVHREYNLCSYSELYLPVELEEDVENAVPKYLWFQRHTTCIMIVLTCLLIGLDVIYGIVAWSGNCWE